MTSRPTRDRAEQRRRLHGDSLLPDARGEVTHSITIRASPGEIWPWLAQLGCGRGGWYSYDLLDNGGTPSARELLPQHQDLFVGQVLPATPYGPDGFEVLEVRAPQVLVLGGLFDLEAGTQLPFASARPPRAWHLTWAFVLEPEAPRRTRLLVRARVAHDGAGGALRTSLVRPLHDAMQRAQLRGIQARAEGRRVTSLLDVAEGVVGGAGILFDLLTPFLRPVRNHWGLTQAEADGTWPGDGIVGQPQWGWTHGVQVDAPPDRVWPWVAQLGQGKGGFYSYEWLENLVGCEVQNAERLHPEWLHPVAGEALRLHPDMPPMVLDEVVPGSFMVARSQPAPGTAARALVSWLFMVEPVAGGRSRLVSRFRSMYDTRDREVRLAYGPWLTEGIGFVMDRKMLLGIKARAEAASRSQRASA